jgi:hypothetical protein
LIGAANRQRIAIESIETSEWHIAPSFDPGRFGDVSPKKGKGKLQGPYRQKPAQVATVQAKAITDNNRMQNKANGGSNHMDNKAIVDNNHMGNKSIGYSNRVSQSYHR